MEKAYKYRIYPNKKQKELIQKTFGCVRYVYNHFLYEQMELYSNEKKHLSNTEMSRELTKLKSENDWLKESDKCALQNTLRDLDSAYKNYFREMKKSGYIRYSKDKLEHFSRINHKPTLYDSCNHPKFKRKKTHMFSYRTTYTNNNIEYSYNHIKLPKLGWVKTRDKQTPQGKILNATISQEPSGKYYVSICCTEVEIKPFPKTNRQIGLDLGLKDFCITSDAEKYANPKYLKKSLDKLVRLQRELSRKTKGGSNWEKTRIKVARQHEKIANQRRDYLNKLSTELVKTYDLIAIEDLKVSNMVKNHKLAMAINDVSWYEFTRQLEYKADWYGKAIKKVDTFYPSSQLCHICGHKNSDVKDLSMRTWICPKCKTEHDRDVNAAINILNVALQ